MGVYHQVPIEETCVTSSKNSFFFQSNFFDEYRIEGKDETNNIYLELVPENLTRAMKSAGNAQAVKIKLTKKHTPCLTFEVTLVSVPNSVVSLTFPAVGQLVFTVSQNVFN